jgi:hypothetical protein
MKKLEEHTTKYVSACTIDGITHGRDPLSQHMIMKVVDIVRNSTNDENGNQVTT